MQIEPEAEAEHVEYSTSQLEQWSKSLPENIQDTLSNLNGKPNKNVSFVSEKAQFRHVILNVIDSGYLEHQDIKSLDTTTALTCMAMCLLRDYKNIDTKWIRGYGPYKDFKNEVDFSKRRIRLSTAAVIQHGCNIENTVRYIGGPHIAAHRNTRKIRKRLSPGVDPTVLNNLIHSYKYGAPKKIDGSSSNENFLKFWRYGNHSTVTDNEEEYKKVMLKDSKRGNSMLIDKRLTLFIPHLHLTPQGLVGLTDKWKSDRPVFDSTFRPDPFSEGINDWVTKDTEGGVTFPGSFVRFLTWIWNMRISYPNTVIPLGDDDVKNAFRLIKNNPAIVAMHGFTGCGYLGFCTGQTFGDSYSPANFDHAAVARTQFAQHLWCHEPDQTLKRAAKYVNQVTIGADPNDGRPFAQANADSLNKGVFKNGKRIPPFYTAHVDDNLYAEVPEFFHLTVACSVISLEDTFGGNHPNQEDVLSDEKFNAMYYEDRTLLGQHPDSRSMTVKMSPRRKEKVLRYLEEEGWILSKDTATIKEIAQVVGLVQSAADYFSWGKAQLLVVQGLLRVTIQSGYERARTLDRVLKRKDDISRRMPSNLLFRLQFLESNLIATYLWRSKTQVSISQEVRYGLRTIYKYLNSNEPWETPMGHIVPRDPFCISYGDASHCAIGVVIPKLKILAMLPFSEHLYRRVKAGEVHINVLEFIALFIGFIMFKTKYEENPSTFPPTPIMDTKGDSMSANSWWRKISTKSIMGQNMLRYYAEYERMSPVTSVAAHIKGIDNIVADDVSRVQELFRPKKTHIYDQHFSTLLQQVCLKYRTFRYWQIFLPNRTLLSDLNSMLSSESLTERPTKRSQPLGHFARVDSIFSTSAGNDESSKKYFL
jgi:hypothetical protein